MPDPSSIGQAFLIESNLALREQVTRLKEQLAATRYELAKLRELYNKLRCDES